MKHFIAIIFGLAWFAFLFWFIGYLFNTTTMLVAIGIWLVMAIISIAYSTWFFGSFKKALAFSLNMEQVFDTEGELTKTVRLHKEFHEEETE